MVFVRSFISLKQETCFLFVLIYGCFKESENFFVSLYPGKNVFCITTWQTGVHFVIYCYCDNPCVSWSNVEQCVTNSNRLYILNQNGLSSECFRGTSKLSEVIIVPAWRHRQNKGLNKLLVCPLSYALLQSNAVYTPFFLADFLSDCGNVYKLCWRHCCV